MSFFDFIVKKITGKPIGIWFNKKPEKKPFDKEEFKTAFEEIAPKIYKAIQDQNRARADSLNPFPEIEQSAELYNWLSYSGVIVGDDQNIPSTYAFGGVAADGQWMATATAATAPTTGLDLPIPPPNNFGNLVVTPKDAPPAKRPKQVLEELKTVPMPWNLEGLDEKIEVMKDKQSLTLQRYANAEITGMIDRLQNRKKYESVKQFFSQFPNTTDEKIDALLKKYPHLQLGTSDLFVPSFPNDAVKAMKEYTNHCKDMCNKKPVFYVIAQKSDFEKKRQRLDPILLAQSPFGMYWQVLGAWDEEMVLLSEL